MSIYFVSDQSNGAPVARAVQPVEQPIGARLRQQRRETPAILHRFLAVMFGHDGHSGAALARPSRKNQSETLGEGGAR